MRVFLIHGSLGKPFENWFPWLEKNLTSMGIECIIPTFPTPKHQDYHDWARLLDYYRDMEMIDKDTVLVGHSAGSVCATKYLADRKLYVRALITVSGYNNYVGGDDVIDALNESFYAKDDFFSRVQEYAQTRIGFLSDNDPFISQEALYSFCAIIGATKIIIKNGGHFNTNAGYTSFPDILESIVKM